MTVRKFSQNVHPLSNNCEWSM